MEGGYDEQRVGPDTGELDIGVWSEPGYDVCVGESGGEIMD